ncbi:hypothetical protein POVCU2_0003190 [Plasmodium ovale curtisi]|uniref:Uncharacterized protein n=1 Tax=Plasmodium ovale curtisi TaxID=864141 RepID=A0A1A8VJU0_PLAOA|nr:hypothetical protein POVCU2_0003190 [Plasmodium ovale curtisi]SBS80792.1 hypothetical protein POVCU1_002970 [Plasmodium ovale curtisi]
MDMRACICAYLYTYYFMQMLTTDGAKNNISKETGGVKGLPGGSNVAAMWQQGGERKRAHFFLSLLSTDVPVRRPSFISSYFPPFVIPNEERAKENMQTNVLSSVGGSKYGGMLEKNVPTACSDERRSGRGDTVAI